MTRVPTRSSVGDRRRRTAPAPRAFTLLELLAVLAILSVLISILAATLVKVRGASRSFVCRNKLRTVAFEFQRFADDFAPPDRGDSDRDGRPGFRVEDFQERLYGIDEFWDGATRPVASFDAGRQPLICPAGPGPVQRRIGVPCSGQAVIPLENVTIGLNMRLDRASVFVGGRPVLKPVRLTSGILDRPSVPVAFDVEGRTAAERGVLPYYSAPPAGDRGLYGTGRLWFSSTRHGGEVNACFVGGHVLSSRSPETEPQWDWAYQPAPE